MKIVAVTSCPTGVAHTSMAANALEQTVANTDGLEIKVEQQGAMGVENELTAEDVKEAAVVILAADKKVDNRDRFTDKPIYEVAVSEPIENPQEVLKAAIAKVS